MLIIANLGPFGLLFGVRVEVRVRARIRVRVKQTNRKNGNEA